MWVCEIPFSLILLRVSSAFPAQGEEWGSSQGPAPVLGISSVLAVPPLKSVCSFRTRGFLHCVGLSFHVQFFFLLG